MHATLKHLQTELTRSILDLNASQTQVRPPGRWSIQQIVEHLTLTYDATESVLTQRLAKGRPTQTKPTFSQHCGRLMVVQLGYFPSGRQAPSAVTPPEVINSFSGDELALRATGHLEGLDKLLHDTERLFGKQNRSVSHLILGPLTPTQWRRFHLVHGLHHVRQIRALRLQLHPSA